MNYTTLYFGGNSSRPNVISDKVRARRREKERAKTYTEKHNLSKSAYDLVNDEWIQAKSGMPSQHNGTSLPDFYALTPDSARYVNELYSDMVTNARVITDKNSGERRVVFGGNSRNMSVASAHEYLRYRGDGQDALLKVGHTAPVLRTYDSDNGSYKSYGDSGRNRAAYAAAIYAVAERHLDELLKKKKK